ncbi:huntingtin-interacting protein K isoform X2 [Peromyscus maniculatus bairdii]|uniref:huntingtin-interacting protein K isoform X2 n=2 Tax=Neotominae TaxID=337963 RepID=UPI001C2E3D68|nr:huntingtin-interacting protein K isoform X2 [Peromyscus maniculatus bairdii]
MWVVNRLVKGDFAENTSPRGGQKQTAFLAEASEDRHKGVVQSLPRPISGRKLRFAGSCEAQPMRRRGEIEMATEGDVELELETETSGPERPPEKPRKHDSGAADLERVTDYAEEKEIQSSNLETGEGTGEGHDQEGRSGVDSE